ncbi:chromate efflux transporter [Corynebacterium sp. HMSC074A01]|uniref:chromate efflux transporter n=1 Tax=Corynebacterium sp. HMSC074A01 TaxID=1715030 RepID=UPI0008A659F8|nr:chromate efflux transporter [Corynebacterium sp. HMSC074A01]OHF36047.1 chromate transporter [Corynebacterium sp. HMSC074A01]
METPAQRGSAAEVFAAFLKLGCTSFGGPVAHLGFFREEFVTRRKWLSDAEYADLVALCQFLPGPASSQVGMALGLRRAGMLGLVAAWVAFTAPSAIALVCFALGVSRLGNVADAGWLIGMKAAAVAVVAHALIGMATSLVTNRWRALIAVAAMVLVLLVPSPLIQVAAILVGVAAGYALLRDTAPASEVTSGPTLPKSAGVTSLGIFFGLLLALPIIARGSDVGLMLIDGFYRAGALVFGGGHVVLPLLEQVVVPTGLVSADVFLAGYGAAQAVPGPLFTFATFLGASASGINWALGAVLATVAIFLPAALLVVGAMPFWDALRAHPASRSVLAGANAAVVGILAAALYTPVFTAGIAGPATMALAAAAFVALRSWKVPAWAVVIAAAAVGLVVL